ncbi:sigma-70 family RNA polymerase sigma factor [Rhodocaloribacter litoris]|uniref:RNA polymerase sigma factor n=1 Tax=Rhodocaloribacter litoris TaxID=2558931 RepID=UPI00141F3BBE|nr:sigma-70 family RNA polymerase sigma factor [Rhodocaloribacter litoris]QXD13801.1 sigma-70 family RNA polymerase sigma factor [Rhodocaloribacter litoris]
MFTQALHAIQAVAAQLPFHLDDTERVNEVFRTWRTRETPETRRLVDVWTYCYTWRYFLMKFMQEPAYDTADFDVLVENAYRKIERHRGELDADNLYAQWVSVVCKNTFLNYVRRRRRKLPLDNLDDTRNVPPPSPDSLDAGTVYLAVRHAIDRLPPALQEAARMRLLENATYEEMGNRLGKPLPTLRTYVNKAIKRLRKDPGLRHLLTGLS